MDFLVAATSATSRPEAVGLLERLSHLELPTQKEYMDALLSLGAFQAVVIAVAGAAVLLQGWKAFKVIVVLNAGVLGGLAGAYLGGMLKGDDLSLIGGIAGGLLLAVLAWPAMRIAISIMGAIAGGALGYGVWHYATIAVGQESLSQHAWAGGLLGLVTLGLLAFVVFQFVVVTLTAIQGSAMAVSGLVSLLLKHPDVREPLYDVLMGNTYLPPLAVAVPVFIGFAFQYAAITKKRKKRKRSSESSST